MMAQLNTTLTAVPNIEQVLQGRSVAFADGFPACRYYLNSVASEKEDNNPGESNFRTYQFQIEIVQQMQSVSKSDAEDLFTDAVEAVMHALESDWTLNGHADNMILHSGSVIAAELPMGACIYVILNMDIKTYVG